MQDKDKIKYRRLTISIPDDLYKSIAYDADYQERSMNYIIIKALRKQFKIKETEED